MSSKKNGRMLEIKGDDKGVRIIYPGISYQIEMSHEEFGRLLDELSDIKACGSLREPFSYSYNVKW